MVNIFVTRYIEKEQLFIERVTRSSEPDALVKGILTGQTLTPSLFCLMLAISLSPTRPSFSLLFFS